MLIQAHHQPKSYAKSDRTNFVAQIDTEEMPSLKEWMAEINQRHPLPDGMQWLICMEDSEHFIKQALPEAP
ncbi:hypothetical protein LCGC14_0358810 [marine sediment metagenome]|uniref:Uncharacterized protein n=1 Tax=marine sediment metagenome TaxID=412755 RepID=A0A0F9VVX6_9ZZZZ